MIARRTLHAISRHGYSPWYRVLDSQACRWANHGALDPVLSIVHNVLHSSGTPPDTTTRAFMEPRFGYDFGRVRMDMDMRAVSALACTVGRDVVFGAGQYAPQTPQGQKLLDHELAHVIQQNSDVASTRGGLDVAKTTDSVEREAERASRAVAGEPVRMAHLLRAARSERAKLEKPLTEAEIGGWI